MASASPQASEAFARHGIIPDVLEKVSQDKLNVTLDNGLKLELGNTLTPTEVKKQPHDIEWNADKTALYTLVETDPDASSREDPKFRCADNRGGWSVAIFAQKHNVGTPVAGNFFQAEYDDYVPDLYKKLDFEA